MLFLDESFRIRKKSFFDHPKFRAGGSCPLLGNCTSSPPTMPLDDVGVLAPLSRLQVLSASEFEVTLYLNQMGVFSYIDDGTLPGCAVLKLSDGRKRSMSLWVEFITASGYLSSRKIRSRFQTLVAQAVDRTVHRDVVRVVADTTEVRLRIRDRYVIKNHSNCNSVLQCLWGCHLHIEFDTVSQKHVPLLCSE